MLAHKHFARSVTAAIFFMLLLKLGGSFAADELDRKLEEVDRLRKGPNTDFDEVQRRCRVLLATYKNYPRSRQEFTSHGRMSKGKAV